MEESILPTVEGGVEKMTLLDISPLELARQLTLRELKEMRKIRVSELKRCAWAKAPSNLHLSPNVLRLTNSFNDLTFWVATSIMRGESNEERVATVKYWLEVSNCLLQLNNFNSSMCIVAALNMGSVQKLQANWEEMGKESRYSLLMMRLQDTFSTQKNYASYRKLLHDSIPPYLPALMPLLSDLIFLEEVPDLLENGHINFQKMTLLSKTLHHFVLLSKFEYNFVQVESISHFIGKCLASVWGEKELYEKANLLKQHKCNLKPKLQKLYSSFSEWQASSLESNSTLKQHTKVPSSLSSSKKATHFSASYIFSLKLNNMPHLLHWRNPLLFASKLKKKLKRDVESSEEDSDSLSSSKLINNTNSDNNTNNFNNNEPSN